MSVLRPFKGFVRGKSILLEAETGLPDGASVTVRIEPQGIQSGNAPDGLMDLCGVWRDDPSIAAIFEEIERERSTRVCREIDFDAPS